MNRFVTASAAPAADLAPAAAPRVSFVTVTYGTGHVVVDMLASLAGTLAGTPAEAIVVDNPHPSHPNRAATELRLFTRGVAVVQPATNTGFGGGCELGALWARGDVLAFVNPDLVLAPGWLEPLLAALGTDTAPSIVAPVLLDPDGSVQEAGQSLDERGNTRPNRERPAGGGLLTVDYASAACWLMRRDEHERLGGFDPAYHPAYFEDVDLALRARALGGSCAVHTGVAVTHRQGTGTPERAAPAFAQQRLLRRRWPEPPTSPAFMSP